MGRGGREEAVEEEGPDLGHVVLSQYSTWQPLPQGHRAGLPKGANPGTLAILESLLPPCCSPWGPHDASRNSWLPLHRGGGLRFPDVGERFSGSPQDCLPPARELGWHFCKTWDLLRPGLEEVPVTDSAGSA